MFYNVLIYCTKIGYSSNVGNAKIRLHCLNCHESISFRDKGSFNIVSILCSNIEILERMK